MSSLSMLCPAIAMVALTFMMLPLILFSRLFALINKKVPMTFFRIFQANNIVLPDFMVQVTRHFSNLFEVPVLFYFLSALVFSSQLTDPLLLNLFWAYFGSRVLHSLIHLTYNDPMHRVVPYFISNVVLVISWVRFVMLMTPA